MPNHNTNTLNTSPQDCTTARQPDCKAPRPHDSFWYAIYTKPRFEKKVDKELKEAGFDVYLPLMSTIRQWSDRKKKVQVPLIPSYIFVKMEEVKLNTLFEFNGVVGVLKHLRKPAIVQDYEIENLKIICQHPDAVESVKSADYKPGMAIQITHGPMMGLYGDCIEIKGKQRILVSVKNLGLEFVLNVPLSYIEPLKNN